MTKASNSLSYCPAPLSPPKGGGSFVNDRSGAVLVEAAFAIPVIIALMFAVLTYATWYMQAHSIQQVTNDAARASLAGLTHSERAALVQESVEQSLLEHNGIDIESVKVATNQSSKFYTVTLSYAAGDHALFKTSFVPLPSETIARSATVELTDH